MTLIYVEEDRYNSRQLRVGENTTMLHNLMEYSRNQARYETFLDRSEKARKPPKVESHNDLESARFRDVRESSGCP